MAAGRINAIDAQPLTQLTWSCPVSCLLRPWLVKLAGWKSHNCSCVLQCTMYFPKTAWSYVGSYWCLLYKSHVHWWKHKTNNVRYENSSQETGKRLCMFSVVHFWNSVLKSGPQCLRSFRNNGNPQVSLQSQQLTPHILTLTQSSTSVRLWKHTGNLYSHRRGQKPVHAQPPTCDISVRKVCNLATMLRVVHIVLLNCTKKKKQNSNFKMRVCVGVILERVRGCLNCSC